ncbi:MAG: DUF1559 family PulG-like putative transporter [Gemmataceae bacterium]
MRKSHFKCFGCLGLGALALGLFFCAGMGMIVPVDFLFNLAFGWILYLCRVFPQVRVDDSGVAMAAICLAALAVGLQWFLSWFFDQLPASAASTNPFVRSWPARRTGVILGLIVLMFVAGIAMVGISHQTGWLMFSPEPLVEGGIREIAYRIQSQNNLKQMALAMLIYQDSEKNLPPAAFWNRQGQPLLSWRVLILPYLEEQSLYKEFHLDEPWDSPHNLRLLPRMPKVYAPLGRAGKVKPYSTPYQVFVGKGAAFEGKRGLRLPEDFPDGTSNTILIVEAAELVPWTKPADLPFDRSRPLPALGWSSRKDFLAALTDGSARPIRRQVSEKTLRAAITRNGGEILDEDW